MSRIFHNLLLIFIISTAACVPIEKTKVINSLNKIIHTVNDVSSVYYNKTFFDILRSFTFNDTIQDKVNNFIVNMKKINKHYEDVIKRINSHNTDDGINLAENLQNDGITLLILIDSIHKIDVELRARLFNKLQLDIFAVHKNISQQKIRINPCPDYKTVIEKYYFIFINIISADLKLLAVTQYVFLPYLDDNPRHAQFLATAAEYQRQRAKNIIDELTRVRKNILIIFERCNVLPRITINERMIVRFSHIFNNDWLDTTFASLKPQWDYETRRRKRLHSSPAAMPANFFVY